MIVAKILISLLLVFIATFIAWALWFSVRRSSRPDPLCAVHGDVPGFSREQLLYAAREHETRTGRDELRRSFETMTPRERHSAGLALRPDTGGRSATLRSVPRAARSLSQAKAEPM